MRFERPFGHLRHVHSKGPAAAAPPAGARHPAVAALSTAANYILHSFALCAAGMYPEITWSVLAELDLLGSRKDAPPSGSAIDSSRNAGGSGSSGQPNVMAVTRIRRR